MPNERITIRLLDNERAAIRSYARHVGVSENYVIRTAIRRMFDLHINDPQPDDPEHLSHVTEEGQ